MGKILTRVVEAMDYLAGGSIKSHFLEGAALTGSDEADEGKFRRISGTSLRDLKPMQFVEAADKSFFLWQRNGLAQRMIQIIVDFIVYDMDVNVKIMKRGADGKKVDTLRTEAQDLWEKFCNDPVNNFYAELPTLVQDKLLLGEICLPVVVNQFDGSVRYGYIDPKRVTTVLPDSSGKQAKTVLVTIPDSSDLKPYDVIRYQFEMPDQALEDQPEIAKVQPQNEQCFFFRGNRVMNQTRGHGELIQLLDWIDGLDQFMFNSLEGGAFRNAFFYTLTIQGKTEKELKEMKIKSPTPGSVRLANEKATWDVVSPELQAADTSEFARLFKNFILGAKGIPEHWFADGGNTNLATAENMGVPVMKMLKRHQNDLKMMVKLIAMFVITRAKEDQLKLADGEYIDVEVSMFDFERKDAAVVSTAFRDIIGSLTVAVSNNWISDEKAKQVVDGLLSRLGVEATEEETVEQIREKNKDRVAEEAYQGAPASGAFTKDKKPAEQGKAKVA